MISSLRVVLDTSALISALRSGAGAAARILELILLGEILVCMDFKVACEYRDVAMRPQHLAASYLGAEEIDRLLLRVEQIAEAIDVVERHRPLSPDPGDDMILDVAINGRVDAIVTNNLRHLAKPAERFGIAVLSPGELLKMLA